MIIPERELAFEENISAFIGKIGKQVAHCALDAFAKIPDAHEISGYQNFFLTNNTRFWISQAQCSDN